MARVEVVSNGPGPGFNPLKPLAALVVLIIVLTSIFSASFTVYEGQQVIITRFGKPIRDVPQAGLHFKMPFLDEARYVDKRILNWDGDPNQIPTKDKKYISVDTTARWRITDPLLFIQTTQSETGARNRLDDILDGATRNAISGHNLVEAVRNSNGIIDKVAEREAAIKAKIAAGEPLDSEDEVSGEIESVSVGREQISEMIMKEASEKLEKFGIELVDVQLKRIAYEKSVEKKVYERMISERKRIAEKIRSVGKGEQAKIEGKVERDLQQIKSEAYRSSQQIKGKAEAQAIAIYAKSLSKDPRFYEFIRTMEAYDKSLKKDTEFILSSDSAFLNLLRKNQ